MQKSNQVYMSGILIESGQERNPCVTANHPLKNESWLTVSSTISTEERDHPERCKVIPKLMIDKNYKR